MNAKCIKKIISKIFYANISQFMVVSLMVDMWSYTGLLPEITFHLLVNEFLLVAISPAVSISEDFKKISNNLTFLKPKLWLVGHSLIMVWHNIKLESQEMKVTFNKLNILSSATCNTQNLILNDSFLVCVCLMTTCCVSCSPVCCVGDWCGRTCWVAGLSLLLGCLPVLSQQLCLRRGSLLPCTPSEGECVVERE